MLALIQGSVAYHSGVHSMVMSKQAYAMVGVADNVRPQSVALL